jgi:Fe-S cluster assembly iron-binding protein IscA
MIEGELTITPSLKEFLIKNNLTIVLDVNRTGCYGDTVSYSLIPHEGYDEVYLTGAFAIQIERGLRVEVDYLNTPLFQGVHLNILNSNKCGCGKSYNV